MKPQTKTTILFIVTLLLTLTNTATLIILIHQPADASAEQLDTLYRQLHGETQMNNAMIWRLWLKLRNITEPIE